MASISASGPARGRPAGTSLRSALRRVAEAAVTPLELADVLDVFHPLRGGARRPARPHRLGDPGDRRVRHHPGEAGPRLGRPRARPVRPGRGRRRRRTPVAHLLADPRPAPRPLPQLHRQGDPRRRGLQPPRAPRPGRPDAPARAGRGRVRAAEADPAQAAAGHRRLRHHPGDRDAAQPVLPPGAGRHRHRAGARQPERVGRDLPRRAAAHGDGRPPPAGRAVRRQPRHPRRRPPRRAGPRPGRAAQLRLRPGRPARRAREAPRRPRPLADHRAVPPASSSRPARAARSPSPTAARSRPTAPPRSSTPPRVPAS